jgi:ABC-2 type transport system permease protein
MSAPALHTVPRRSWSARQLRGLVVSEIRKTLSTSSWWALLIPTGLLGLTWGLTLKWTAGVPAMSLYLSLTSAMIFAMLSGVVCVAAEHRHHTIATSYLVVGHRPKLVVAKMILAAMVGAGYAVVATDTSIAGLLITGMVPSAELPSMLQAGAGAAPVLALSAMLGVGIGTLISKRLLAILGTLLYLIIVEPIVVMLVGRESATTYLPGESVDAALGGLTGGAQFQGGFGVAQPWWLMMLVFAGWVAVVGLTGAVAAQRRDIA